MIILETRRLNIRHATVRDAAMLYALWTDAQVMHHVGYPQGLRVTLRDVMKLLEQEEARGDTPFNRVLVADHRSTGGMVGECKVIHRRQDDIWETDIKLVPRFWGIGLGGEIKAALLDYIFTHTQASAVQATPNIHNEASIRIQERVGAVRVGEDVYEFPERMRDHTEPVRHYIYRVSREEWQRRREEVLSR